MNSYYAAAGSHHHPGDLWMADDDVTPLRQPQFLQPESKRRRIQSKFMNEFYDFALGQNNFNSVGATGSFMNVKSQHRQADGCSDDSTGCSKTPVHPSMQQNVKGITFDDAHSTAAPVPCLQNVDFDSSHSSLSNRSIQHSVVVVPSIRLGNIRPNCDALERLCSRDQSLEFDVTSSHCTPMSYDLPPSRRQISNIQYVPDSARHSEYPTVPASQHHGETIPYPQNPSVIHFAGLPCDSYMTRLHRELTNHKRPLTVGENTVCTSDYADSVCETSNCLPSTGLDFQPTKHYNSDIGSQARNLERRFVDDVGQNDDHELTDCRFQPRKAKRKFFTTEVDTNSWLQDSILSSNCEDFTANCSNFLSNSESKQKASCDVELQHSTPCEGVKYQDSSAERTRRHFCDVTPVVNTADSVQSAHSTGDNVEPVFWEGHDVTQGRIRKQWRKFNLWPASTPFDEVVGNEQFQNKYLQQMQQQQLYWEQQQQILKQHQSQQQQQQHQQQQQQQQHSGQYSHSQQWLQQQQAPNREQQVLYHQQQQKALYLQELQQLLQQQLQLPQYQKHLHFQPLQQHLQQGNSEKMNDKYASRTNCLFQTESLLHQSLNASHDVQAETTTEHGMEVASSFDHHFAATAKLCFSLSPDPVIKSHDCHPCEVASHRCAICRREFFSKASLKSHALRHSGEKPFPCSQCGKTFRHRSTLAHHALKHGGVKGYACHVCGAKFTLKYNMERHAKKFHQLTAMVA